MLAIIEAPIKSSTLLGAPPRMSSILAFNVKDEIGSGATSLEMKPVCQTSFVGATPSFVSFQNDPKNKKDE